MRTESRPVRPPPAAYIDRPAVVCCIKATQEVSLLTFIVQQATSTASLTLAAVPAVAPRITNVLFNTSRYSCQCGHLRKYRYLPQRFPAVIDVVRGQNEGLHLTYKLDVDSAAGHTRLRFRYRTSGVIYGRDV
jgi:hypothetical protein